MYKRYKRGVICHLYSWSHSIFLRVKLRVCISITFSFFHQNAGLTPFSLVNMTYSHSNKKQWILNLTENAVYSSPHLINNQDSLLINGFTILIKLIIYSYAVYHVSPLTTKGTNTSIQCWYIFLLLRFMIYIFVDW